MRTGPIPASSTYAELPAQLTINGVLRTITGIHPDDGATGSLTYDTRPRPLAAGVFTLAKRPDRRGKSPRPMSSPRETTPAAAPQTIARVVLDRLTAERAALHRAPILRRARRLRAQGRERRRDQQADPEIAAAVTALDAVASSPLNRWAALLA